jgi:hypothetical protein
MNPAHTRVLRALTAAALILSVFSSPAFAFLGGDASSVQQDSALRHSQDVSTVKLQFERHDLTTAGGSIHEYVSRSGKVFAIAWNGQVPPNLKQLFGAYFDSYHSAVAARSAPGMHRHVAIVQPDLVVQDVGRLRGFRGVAYVPSLVPVGFDLSDLQ